MPNEEIRNSKRAKARWKLLAEALKKKTSCDLQNNQHSVRRFSGFSLFNVENISSKSESNTWFRYSLKGNAGEKSLKIRLLNSSISTAELIGFNNTGNICIWPSEELLARYCIDHPELFIGKNVCELGGGMTSLAGLQVGLHTAAKYVLLTDGNNQSVQNLDVIVQHNINSFGKTTMLTRELIWCETDDEYQDLHHAFDVVICADCLFFVNVHTALINTIRSLLNQDGVCIILAPRRSGTLSKFIDLASAVFKIKVEERYDEVIWQLHEELKIKDDLYSPDLHYPILIKMWVRDSAT